MIESARSVPPLPEDARRTEDLRFADPRNRPGVRIGAMVGPTSGGRAKGSDH